MEPSAITSDIAIALRAGTKRHRRASFTKRSSISLLNICTSHISDKNRLAVGTGSAAKTNESRIPFPRTLCRTRSCRHR